MKKTQKKGSKIKRTIRKAIRNVVLFVEKVINFLKIFGWKAPVLYILLATAYAAIYYGIASAFGQSPVVKDSISTVISLAIFGFALRTHYKVFKK